MSTTFDLSQFADTYVEPQAVDAGEEYELRIIAVNQKVNDNGPFLMPRFEVVGHDEANDVSMYLGLPSKDRPQKDNNRIIKRLQQFCQCFDLPDPLQGELNVEDWIGSTGYAILGQEEYEGEMQNNVKKLMVRR